MVDHHTKVAAENLVEQHGNPSRPKHVGKIFQPFMHNYLYGVTRLHIVEQITARVRKGQSLQSIWQSMNWFNQKNREDARSLSVMGVSKEKWAVQFAEVLMIDIKAKYEASNQQLLINIPIELTLLWFVFGMDWRLLGKIFIAGVAFSELSGFYRENKGFSMVEFLSYGVIMQHLYQKKKLVSLPSLFTIGIAFLPLYFDAAQGTVEHMDRQGAHGPRPPLHGHVRRAPSALVQTTLRP